MATGIGNLILILFFMASLNAHGVALPENFVIEGRLYDTAGAPIAAAVDIELEVYAQGAPTCVLYREIHQNVNVDSTTNNNNDGIFAVKLGDGTLKPGSFAAVQLSRIFTNSVALNGDSNNDDTISAECSRNTTELTSAARFVRVSVKLNGSPSPFDPLSPDSVITSVPSAMVAESLQGVDANGFVKIRDDVSTDLNQSNVESVFSATNFAKLMNLLSGSFGNQTVTNVGTPSAGTDATNKSYVDGNIGGKAADASAVGPAAGNGHTLIWDQALNRWVTGVPSALDATKLPLTGGTMTGTLNMGAQTLHLGNFTSAAQTTLEVSVLSVAPATHKGKIWFNTTTNTTMVWDGSASVPLAAGASGTAGGDLTGTYPNPVIASGVVGTAELADGAVSSAKINNSGIAVNRLLMTDATTGATVEYKTCALDESLKWTATGWACTTAAAFLGNSGVTAATYGNATQVAQVQFNNQGRAISAANVNIAFPVVSVAGKTGAVTLNTADVSGLGTAAVKAFGTSAGDLVELDGVGRIPASLLPATVGDIQEVSAGTGLTGGATTGSATLSVDTGVTTGKIVQMAASDRLPAVDGSNLTQINAVRLQTYNVSATAPSANQVLKWNAAMTSWEPSTLAAGGDFLASGTVPMSGNIRLNGNYLSGDGDNEGIFVSNTGNVGIGTSSPTLPLEIEKSSGTMLNMSLRNTSASSTTFYRAGNDSGYSILFGVTGTTFSSPGIYETNAAVVYADQFLNSLNLGTEAGAPVKFFTGNTQRMMINPAGQVGIGTTNPQSLLHVNGVVRATDICDENGANCKDISGGWGAGGDIDGVIAGTGLTGSYISGTGTLSVDVGSTANKIVQLDSSARLPAIDGRNLSNVSAVQLQTRNVASTPPTASQVLGWNSGNSTWEPVTQSVAGALLNGGNSFGAAATLGTNDNFALNLEANGATAITILPNGNVGVGDSSPAHRLSVNGNTSVNNGGADFVNLLGTGYVHISHTNGSIGSAMRITNASTAIGAGSNFDFRNGPSARASIEAINQGNSPALGVLKFSTAQSGGMNEVLRLDQFGNVGIGTNNPQSLLHVNGVVRATDICDENGANCKDISAGWGAGGDIDGVIAGTGLTGSYISGTGTLSVDVGVTSNKIVQLDSSARLPAVDGSQITNVNAMKIATRDVANVNPTANQVLAWNGSAWVPSSPSTDPNAIVNNGNSLASAMTIGTNDNFSLNLETNGISRLSILNNGRVGIGTTNPNNNLEVVAADANTGVHVANISSTADRFPHVSVTNFKGPSGNGGHAGFFLNAARGDSGAPSAVQAGDSLGIIAARGYGGSNYLDGAYIAFQANDAFLSGGSFGASNILFSTAPQAGGSPLERMRIGHDGSVGIGGIPISGQERLFVNGAIKIASTGVGCGPGQKGMIRFNDPDFELCSGGAWTPIGGGGGVTSIIAGDGLSGGVITSSGTIAVDTTIAKLSGRPSGQTFNGGTAASENLTLDSTANATKGAIIIAPTGGNVGIGTASPSQKLSVVGNATVSGQINGIHVGDRNLAGAFNLALGTNALAAAAAGAMDNTAVGYNALTSTTTSTGNTAVGSFSMATTTSGYENTSLGSNALASLTTGHRNLALGYDAGSAITTGSRNVVIGSNDGSSIATLNNYILMSDGLGNERFRIDNSGNMGIGTTTPASRLDVNGNVKANFFVAASGGGAGGACFTAGQFGYSAGNLTVCDGSIYRIVGTGGTVTSVVAGTGLMPSSITGAGTLNVDVGTVTGKIVQMAASNRLPAVDGSNLTQVNAVKLAGNHVNATLPSSSQFLKWNSGTSEWEPNLLSPSDLPSAIMNGGNSFGALATVGTNDNFGLSFETNGTPAMTISSNGSVGIGTTSANKTLELYRAASSDASFVMRDGDVAHGTTGIAATDEFFSIVPVMSLNGGAYLRGISDLPGVSGIIVSGVIGSASPTPGTPAILLNAVKKNGTNAQALAGGDTAFQVRTDTNNLLTVLGNGAVGIGTTAPGALLDINGTMRAQQICDEFGANCRDLSLGVGNFSGSSLTNIGNIVGTANMTIASGTGNTDLTLNSSGTGAVRLGYATPHGPITIGYATPLLDTKLTVADSLLNPTTSGFLQQNNLNLSFGSATSGDYASILANVNPTATASSNGKITGVQASSVVSAGSTGTINTIIGVESIFGNRSAGGLVNNAYGVLISPDYNGTSPITNAYSLYMKTPIGNNATNKWAVYQEDIGATNFFAGRVAIGTSTTASALEVYKDNSANVTIRNGSGSALGHRASLDIVSNIFDNVNSFPSSLSLTTKRGPSGSNLPLLANYPLGEVSFFGSNTASSVARGARIYSTAAADFTGSEAPSKLHFATTPLGSLSPLPRMTIDQDGSVGIGTTTPGAALDVNGMIQSSGFSRLVTAYNITSSTTLATVPGWSVNLVAGKTYAFEINLYLTAGATGGGVRVDLNGGTATAASVIGDGVLFDGANFRNSTRINFLNNTVCAFTTTTTGPTCRINGTMTVGTSGTFMIRFAQNLSNATASGVAAGSTMKFFQIQ